MRLTTSMAVAVGMLVPALGSASTVVLTPLIPDEVDGKAQLAVHQLVASELEFQPNVSGVTVLDARPDSLDDACLTQPSCLGGIVRGAGGDRLITGKMSAESGSYNLDFLLFDAATNQIVRRKTFPVASDPTSMANGMTAIMRELLTGQAPQPDAGAASLSAAEAFREAEGDDFHFAPAPAPSVAARTSPPPPRPMLEDLDDLDNLSIERRRGGVATAPPPPIEPAPLPPPPEPEPEPEFDASMIRFGGSVEDITTEEIHELVQFGSPPPVIEEPPALVNAPAPVPVHEPAPQVAYQPPPQPTYQPAPEPVAYAPPPPPPIQDLDAPPEDRANRQGAARSTRAPKAEGEGHQGANFAQLTLRGGYSRYHSFNFVTAGAEIAVPVVAGLHLLAGLESYSVNRRLPVELQVQLNQINTWDTIFPINVGAMYKFTGGVVQPYAGADAIFVQYYRDEIGSDWAGGGRGRIGADFMLTQNFGLNLNAAVGFWTGANWSLIDRDLENSGLLPQISAGTILAF